jgi:hypothetical protein
MGADGEVAPRAVIPVIVIEPEIRPETDLDRAAGDESGELFATY